MKQPYEIGTFLHKAGQNQSDFYVLLITGRTKYKKDVRYVAQPFYYSPNAVSSRLTRFAWWRGRTISSSVIKKEGWQPVDVSKGEVAGG